jgi:transposase
MDSTCTFVGIDVAKDRLDVHLRPSGQSWRLAHDEAHLAELAERLGQLRPRLVVLEATGRLHRRVAAVLTAVGVPIAVVNPRQIRDFARATGRLAKTDALDAEAIARFAEAVQPAPRPLPDAATLRLLPSSPAGGSSPRCSSPRRTAASRQAMPPCGPTSTLTSPGSTRPWPRSTASWIGPCAPAHCGAPRRSCS